MAVKCYLGAIDSLIVRKLGLNEDVSEDRSLQYVLIKSYRVFLFTSFRHLL